MTLESISEGQSAVKVFVVVWSLPEAVATGLHQDGENPAATVPGTDS